MHVKRQMEALAERVGSPPAPAHTSAAPDRRRAPRARSEVNVRSRNERLNRAVNFALALIAIVLLLPLFLLIALVVRLTSRGPALYTQERVGVDRRSRHQSEAKHRRRVDVGGTPFTIYKFRTMVADAERESGAVWAAQVDPRVTPIGRILRQYRLDELPQLFNVLKGDMNIVGPRPERPQIFARLRAEIAEYPLRQRAKPGITGLAQINHHYDRSIDDVRTKVRYDLEYLRRHSVREDLRIMLKTIPTVLFRRGGW